MEFITWLTSFLQCRTQQVVLNNGKSDEIQVMSGVPRGSVLGLCLFLFFIYDLPNNFSSKIRLFADDPILYRTITNPSDSSKLETDLTTLERWEKDWQMQFNPIKCQILSISKRNHFINTNYQLHSTSLERVNTCK
jgi:hypothetical protein